MKLKTLFLMSALALSIGPSISQAQAARAAREAQKTVAAVKAVDDHWGEAENHGDTTYLKQLLLPGYRSVGADGVAHSRSQILAGAAKRIDPAASARAVADSVTYVTAHPSGVSVLLHGNTAVLSFYSRKLGPEKGVKGSDIFVYAGGHWHAIYSEHSTAR